MVKKKNNTEYRMCFKPSLFKRCNTVFVKFSGESVEKLYELSNKVTMFYYSRKLDARHIYAP